jgi:hypothetical protein
MKMGKGQLFVKSGTSINKCEKKKRKKKNVEGKGATTIKQTPPIAADEDPPREDKTGG